MRFTVTYVIQMTIDAQQKKLLAPMSADQHQHNVEWYGDY